MRSRVRICVAHERVSERERGEREKRERERGRESRDRQRDTKHTCPWDTHYQFSIKTLLQRRADNSAEASVCCFVLLNRYGGIVM